MTYSRLNLSINAVISQTYVLVSTRQIFFRNHILYI